MAKLAIQDLAAILSAKNGMPQEDLQRFITKLFEVIQTGVERDNLVKVKGLGSFKVIGVEARESVNISTGERVMIDSHAKVTFAADVTMRELVNKPFSGFETVVLNEGVSFDDMPLQDALGLVSDENEEPNAEPLEEPVASETTEEPAASETTEEPAPAPIEEPASTNVEEPAPAPIEEPAPEPEPEPIAEPEPEVIEEPVPEPEREVEPVPVQEPVVEPEPVVESEPAEEPAPVAEPVVEPVQEPEPASTVAPEPVPVSEPVSEPVPEPEPTPEPVAEPVAAPEPAAEPLVEFVDEEVKGGWMKWLLLGFVACVLSFGAGYYLGNRHSLTESAEPISEPAKPAVVAEKDSSSVVKNDSVSEKAEAVPAKNDTIQAQVETPAPAVVDEKKKDEEWAVSIEKANEKYEAMDSRIRTGAYYIVGTKEVVTVQEGDNLRKIAVRSVGTELICYIEAYNGIKATDELKVGQEIKIPDLKWKKNIRSLKQKK